ncbi:MAG: helix-turn-helix transcriptional regulator [Sphaerotilus sp.]|nr:helix-turn-helix transcriptional regulator [Sphaerotilus sp.]
MPNASFSVGHERLDWPRADTGPSPATHNAHWLLHMLTGALDELDYGMLIVDVGGHLVQANQMGYHHCTAMHGSCRLQGQQLHTRASADDPVLQRALALAAAGRRSLLKLGDGPHAETVAVVPLNNPQGGHADGAILLVFGKHQVCEALSVEHFARVHNLTHAEGMVLTALCNGDEPSAIARQFGVAVSTVRTQIASVRQKTQATSIRDLVRQVAMLPPIVSVLGHEAAH